MLHRRAFMSLAALTPLALRAAAARAEEPSRITIAQPSEGFLYLPIYAARGLGCFRDEGLEVEVTVFFLVFLNTYTGVHSVSPEQLAILRLMGAGERALISKVIVPSALTWVFTGLRL